MSLKVERMKSSKVKANFIFLSTFLTFKLLLGCAFMPLTTHSSLLPTPHSPLPDTMAYIPGGTFLMGSSEQDGKIGFEIGVDELPKHKVRLSGFSIDRYEVTEKEYYDYLLATGKKKYPGYWREAGRPDKYPEGYESYPVSDIDWFDAVAYCRWAGKRLPTETEWEKAARGTDGRLWPWGNEFVAGKSNTEESSRRWNAPRGQKNSYGWKAPVGVHGEDISPYGVYDMAGNVKEWTASSYKSYRGNKIKPVAKTDRFKILRGGSYLTPAVFSRTAVRVAVAPTIGPRETDGWHSDYTYGFRCAKEGK